MGSFCHHAIIVTSYETEKLVYLRSETVKLFGERRVSPVSEAAWNDYRSFCVFPDGAKEGGDESLRNDKLRGELINLIRSYGFAMDYAHVQYAEDTAENDRLLNSTGLDLRGEFPNEAGR